MDRKWLIGLIVPLAFAIIYNDEIESFLFPPKSEIVISSLNADGGIVKNINSSYYVYEPRSINFDNEKKENLFVTFSNIGDGVSKNFSIKLSIEPKTNWLDFHDTIVENPGLSQSCQKKSNECTFEAIPKEMGLIKLEYLVSIDLAEYKKIQEQDPKLVFTYQDKSSESQEIILDVKIDVPQKPETPTPKPNPKPNTITNTDYRFTVSEIDEKNWTFQGSNPLKLERDPDILPNEVMVFQIRHKDLIKGDDKKLEIVIHWPNNFEKETNVEKLTQIYNNAGINYITKNFGTKNSKDIFYSSFACDSIEIKDTDLCVIQGFIDVHKDGQKLGIIHTWVERSKTSTQDLKISEDVLAIMNSFKFY